MLLYDGRRGAALCLRPDASKFAVLKISTYNIPVNRAITSKQLAEPDQQLIHVWDVSSPPSRMANATQGGVMLKWKQGWGEEDLLYTIARVRA